MITITTSNSSSVNPEQRDAERGSCTLRREARARLGESVD
jgi:hypothetical protein